MDRARNTRAIVGQRCPFSSGREPVRTPEQSAGQREPHFREHESKDFGKVRQPRPAARFEQTPSSIRKLGPMLGADNESILNELGYSAEEIELLKRNRVLHQRAQLPT